jgi:isoleucyl-tRNA synthetase
MKDVSQLEQITKVVLVAFLVTPSISGFERSILIDPTHRSVSVTNSYAISSTDFQKIAMEVRQDPTIKILNLSGHKEFNDEHLVLLKDLKNCKDLREFLIVSKVEVEIGSYDIQAEKAPGEKCVRCWVYSTEISQESSTLGVCPKCVEALS